MIKFSDIEENIIHFPKIQNNNYDIIDTIALECFKKLNFKSVDNREIVDKFLDIKNTLSNALKKDYKTDANRKPQEYNIDNTVFDDYIICLEDGKKMKMLSRHLRTKYNMSFQEYKQKWGLPIDYPYVCKNYSQIRANIATKKKRKS